MCSNHEKLGCCLRRLRNASLREKKLIDLEERWKVVASPTRSPFIGVGCCFLHQRHVPKEAKKEGTWNCKYWWQSTDNRKKNSSVLTAYIVTALRLSVARAERIRHDIRLFSSRDVNRRSKLTSVGWGCVGVRREVRQWKAHQRRKREKSAAPDNRTIQFSLRRDAFRVKSIKKFREDFQVSSLSGPHQPIPLSSAQQVSLSGSWCWQTFAEVDCTEREQKREIFSALQSSNRDWSDSETGTFDEIRRKRREKTPCIWSLVEAPLAVTRR